VKNLIVFSLAIFVFGLAYGGCKKDSPTESQTTQPSTPPATQATFPTGSFTATDADGRWVQTYKTDSTFTLTKNGVAHFTLGKYSLSGNRVVFSDNSSLCSSLGDGTYTWSFNGTSLTFICVTDACIARKNTQISNTWTKTNN
jgi:hypothetical protein